ncbi:ROK family protein [Nonomuraea sp. NPDC050790]|uniref:ROK family transcriptional regulator n=1 Tax=Nonomuraea sp. NPDC050790 TaxID=3364371 RepID=UPI0037A3D571
MTNTARGLVLRLLRDAGPMPRAELARRTGLSATTMTKVVAQLIADGCLAEGPTATPRVGRPATDVALLPEAFWVVGAHSGAGGVRLGLRDLLGRSRGGAVPACGPLAEEIPKLVAASGVDPARVLGVGVTAPDGRVAERLAVPLGPGAVTGHDACAMALAEARYGCRARDLVHVHVDGDVSAGAVLDGRPFRPADLGHLRVTEDGPRCCCGGTGCLAAVLSEPALSARLPVRAAPGQDVPPVRAAPGQDVPPVRAAPDQDVPAGRVVPDRDLMAAVAADPVLGAEVAGWLATALAAAVALLRPERITLGGMLARAPEDLLDRVRAALGERTREPVPLGRCGLGPDPGVAGAAALALDRFFYGQD